MVDLRTGLIVFFISMLPVFELRGGMVFAAAKGLPLVTAYLICVAGSILPVPIVLLFIRRFLVFLERIPYAGKFVRWTERRARSKQQIVLKYQWWGLLLCVAVPLPGTGAWMGSLVAALMDMQMRRSFPAIALGVILAGIIMSVLSFWIPGLFFTVK
ncbi:MAG: small multi-drug export protein [Clostridia bacterium]|nr:small multi-drug export protein [Clostridia bacterium]